MTPYFLAVAAGVSLVLAFPPFGQGWVAFAGATLFWLAVRQSSDGRRAALAGFVAGFIFYGILLWWIANLGWIAWFPLIGALAAFPAITAAVAHRVRNRPDLLWALLAAAVWGVVELIRARFPLGGLPWGALGFAVGEYPWTRAAAQWIGASGWTVVVVGSGALVALAIERRRPILVVPALVVFGGLAVAGGLVPPSADGRELRVAIVQGEDPCPAAHCEREREYIYQSHLELTRRHLSRGDVDLVVWAESSAGFATDPALNPGVAAEVAAEAQRLDAYLILGSDRPVGDTGFLNVNILFSPEGEMVGEYRKIHPVPFGEYVPARALFGWIRELDRVPRDMVQGEGPVVFELPQGRFGSVISFEAAFDRYFKAHVAAGADLMVVATNQSSYGLAPASDQLIGITRVRAAELGIDVVHSAVTGRSTFIAASGETGYRTDLYRGEVITGVVRFADGGPTLFFLLGDWVVYGVAGAAVALEILFRIRRRAAV